MYIYLFIWFIYIYIYKQNMLIKYIHACVGVFIYIINIHNTQTYMYKIIRFKINYSYYVSHRLICMRAVTSPSRGPAGGVVWWRIAAGSSWSEHVDQMRSGRARDSCTIAMHRCCSGCMFIKTLDKAELMRVWAEHCCALPGSIDRWRSNHVKRTGRERSARAGAQVGHEL